MAALLFSFFRDVAYAIVQEALGLTVAPRPQRTSHRGRSTPAMASETAVLGGGTLQKKRVFGESLDLNLGSLLLRGLQGPETGNTSTNLDGHRMGL